MPAPTAVLAANAAFYQAFSQQDYAAMATLWAQHYPVACIHPGWPPLIGRDAVLRSWKDVLRAPEPVDIRIENVRSLEYGPGAALVLCAEVLNGRAVLAASNLIVLEDGVWRIAFHQAGQVVAPLDNPDAKPAGRIVH